MHLITTVVLNKMTQINSSNKYIKRLQVVSLDYEKINIYNNNSISNHECYDGTDYRLGIAWYRWWRRLI